MKNKFIFFIFLSCLVIISTSFNRTYDHRYLKPDTYWIYWTDNVGYNNPIFANVLPDACSVMTPQYYVGNLAPNLTSGGNIGVPDLTSTTGPDFNCTLSWGPWPSDVAMTTRSYSSGQFTEFDILINSTYSDYSRWGNGYNNTYDRLTCLKHELGHAVGLSHVSRSPMRLMSTPYYVSDGVIDIGQDEQRGYSCIYDGYDCQYDEGGCSDAKISTGIDEKELTKSLIWTVGNEDNNVQGFNIYQKDGNKYKSLNKRIIKQNQTNEYNFIVPNSKQEYEYFLEIVDGHNKVKLVPFK